MKSTRFPRLAALAACFAAVMSQGSQANVTARSVTEAQTGVAVISTSADFTTCSGCVATSSDHGTVPEPGGGTSQSDSLAWAVAEHGILKAYAVESSIGPHGRAKATATLTFGDAVTIDAPGLTGQAGTVSMLLQFDFSGHVTAPDGSGSGQVRLHLDVDSGLHIDRYQRAVLFNPDGQVTTQAINPGNVAVPFSPQILAQVDFVFGQSFSFTATLIASGVGSLQQRVEVDASHSAYWGGFQSVLDAGGNAVNYSVTSSSQTDWSQSFVPATVPEPGTWALLLAGIGAVSARARRKAKEPGSSQGLHRPLDHTHHHHACPRGGLLL